MVCREGAELTGQRQHDGDFFARLQREHVDDRPAARVARALRHLPDLEPIDPAAVAEAQDPVVRVGDEQLVDPVVVLGLCRLLATAAALLRPVLGQRLALDVAGVAERDDHVGGRDQVLGAEFLHVVLDLAAARAQLGLAELQLHGAELFRDDEGHALGFGQDVEQVGDLGHHLLVLADDLVLLQSGQALQPHLQDLAGLVVTQAVQAVSLQAHARWQSFGPVGFASAWRLRGRTHQHLAHHRAVPALGHQCGLGHWRRRRGLDGLDELVDVGQRHRQAFEHMAALASATQCIHRAPGHDFSAVLQKDLEQLLEVAKPWLTVDQRHHVDAEGVLQLGLLVQIVEHHLGHFAALQVDHHPHAGLVALVLDVADAFDFLLVHQLGDAFEQGFLVDLVGQLVDDDGLARAAVDVLEVALGPHDHPAAAGAVAFTRTLNAVDDAGGGKVGRRHDLHQLVDRRLWVPQQVQTGVDDLVEVVRRNVGRHAHGNASRAVDQQIRQPRWQHGRLFFRAVVVRREVDRFLVDVGQHLVGDLGQADFGVAHRRRVVAVHRAEVALAIDQHVAQRKVLRHANNGVVHRGVAVRVVLADHVPDDASALLVSTVPVVVEFVHREQHAPVDWLEAVTRVRQRTTDDHAHRVIQIRAPHLLFEADGQCFLGEGRHAVLAWRRRWRRCCRKPVGAATHDSNGPKAVAAVQQPGSRRRLPG